MAIKLSEVQDRVLCLGSGEYVGGRDIKSIWVLKVLVFRACGSGFKVNWGSRPAFFIGTLRGVGERGVGDYTSLNRLY